ncbi:hypothetical protein C0J52_05576 [Blattella germanica]|nr:hypothetical protein C0J52_05576 [Blattella germanica]
MKVLTQLERLLKIRVYSETYKIYILNVLVYRSSTYDIYRNTNISPSGLHEEEIVALLENDDMLSEFSFGESDSENIEDSASDSSGSNSDITDVEDDVGLLTQPACASEWCNIRNDDPEPKLADELLKMSMITTDTVMTNRKGLPVEIKKGAGKKKGDVLAFRKGDQLALSWKDKKCLTEDKVLDILYNDDSGDDLIPELDSNSESKSDNEIPISPVAKPIEQHHPSYCPTILPFSENQGLNIQLENEDDIRPLS